MGFVPNPKKGGGVCQVTELIIINVQTGAKKCHKFTFIRQVAEIEIMDYSPADKPYT